MGSDLAKKESYVSKELNLIKNRTIIPNIVRIYVTFRVNNQLDALF
jgi:hypothetical protein